MEETIMVEVQYRSRRVPSWWHGQATIDPLPHIIPNLLKVPTGMTTIGVNIILLDPFEVHCWDWSDIAIAHYHLTKVVNTMI